jgi:hypothetical protein
MWHVQRLDDCATSPRLQCNSNVRYHVRRKIRPNHLSCCHSYFVFALEFIRISCYIISSFDLKEKFLGIFLSHISKKLLMISLRLGLLLISISFTQLVRAQCWKEKDSNSPKYYTFNGSISCLKNEFTPKDALSM